jgi:hypothetical protein
MQREKLSIEDIDAILHHEMTQRLGYDAKDHRYWSTTSRQTGSRTGMRISRRRALRLFLS